MNEDIFAEKIHTLRDNVKRFEKHGTITPTVVTNKQRETAKVGLIDRGEESVYIVFYPDGTFDRFEHGEAVSYRDGWFSRDIEPIKTSDKAPARSLTDEQRKRKNERARELYWSRKEASEKRPTKTKKSSSAKKKKQMN